MITVIIAGGSGTRLWPLSTSNYPKQLLALTNEKSMVQNTYERAKEISSSIYVVPDASHAHHIKEQLSELGEENFVVEPARRGTASCIVAALAHISKRHGDEEPIAFIHADHHIRDVRGFVKSFNLAAKYATTYDRITLIGIEPTHPATGFGYIEKGDTVDGELLTKVARFKEKPDFQTAKKFLASGKFVWNCGYFVGTVKSFLREFEEHNPQRAKDFNKLVNAESQEEYEKAYLESENDAIDYALMERTTNLQVIPATFDWMDLGSFKDLHDANESDEKGNYFRGSNVEAVEVENAFIRNEEDKPLAVIGLDNIVVVNTKDGILVARKDLSQKVGDIAKKIQGK